MSDARDPGRAGPSIHVHIERIVVTGVDVRDGPALGAAVQAEMTRLFTERGWPDAPQSSVASDRLSGGAVPAAPRVNSADLGTRIGSAVHGGLVR